MSTYRFNTTDPETAWGLHFEPGLDAQLLAAPKKKDNGLSISWAGENGTERYHGIKAFESKTYSISCVILASSQSDFMSKWSGLTNFLLTEGEFEFTVLRLSRKWKVSYLDMGSPEKIGVFGSNNLIGFRFNLRLVDDYPAEIFEAE